MTRTAADAVAEALLTGQRLALGRIRPATNRMPGEAFSGADLAARNLLGKALRALADEDDERAAKLVKRASRFPYDEYEQWWPDLNAAGSALLDEIIDALEAPSQERIDDVPAVLRTTLAYRQAAAYE